MTKLKINDNIIFIDCKNDFCWNCSKLNEPLCGLFNVMVDRIINENPDNSGLKRCLECFNAEEIE